MHPKCCYKVFLETMIFFGPSHPLSIPTPRAIGCSFLAVAYFFLMLLNYLSANATHSYKKDYSSE